MSGAMCGSCDQEQEHIRTHETDQDCLAEALARLEETAEYALSVRSALAKMQVDRAAEVGRMHAEWNDLRDRLAKAARSLDDMARREARSPEEKMRLGYKADGVELALDYMRSYRR